MMPLLASLLLPVLLVLLALGAYVDRVYSEMGKFLAREYQDNVDSWEELVEPRLRLGRESVALSASVLRQLSLGAVAFVFGVHFAAGPQGWLAFSSTAFELVLLIVLFDRLTPQILFARTEGRWIARIRLPLQVLFYLVLPITMLLSLLLSIAALAEPEEKPEEEHPSEAMDALLEAGEEEGILEQSDRNLVRSVVEFGDKVVREIMTPRPEIFAVADSLTLREFIAAIRRQPFSRVPVYHESFDEVTGIVFAHDLLHISDGDAAVRMVGELQRAAAFVPETKMVPELLREMQHEKQHMRIVIDEYGSVAGLVTIEDLIEAIVGNIADEHDLAEQDDSPVREPDGTYIVGGTFELARLRELLEQDEPGLNGVRKPTPEPGFEMDENAPLRLSKSYESTTLGGLVSELAGHIPLPGEVIEEDGLRLEVLASTDRRIERIRVSRVLEAEPERAAAERRGA